MKLLGGVLAGGASRRFGQPKAFALLHGRALIDHVIACLARQCAQLVLLGGPEMPPWPRIEDSSGEGPGAGILAGLEAAQRLQLDALLVVPCDAPLLPNDLAARLVSEIGDATVAYAFASRAHPAFSLWRVAALKPLRKAMTKGERRLEALADCAGPASLVTFDEALLANINEQAELERLSA